MKGIVGEVCVREVVFGRPEESVLEIAKRMREHHVGTVVLVREEGDTRTPVSIVTDRDIVVEVVAPEAGDPAKPQESLRRRRYRVQWIPWSSRTTN